MNTNIIYSIFETLGIGVFLFFVFKGLSSKISTLEEKARIQIDTLKVMEKRIEETERVGSIYKNLIRDIPNDIENYKTFISRTRDDIILELRDQNEEMKGKLNEAKLKIEDSKQSQDHIKKYLHTLVKVVTPIKDKDGLEKEYLIRDLSDFEGRKLEESIMHLVDEKTLDAFLKVINFNLVVTEDKKIINTIFHDKSDKILPSGEKIRNAKATLGMHEWSLIVNNYLFLNQAMLDNLNVEFVELKT